MASLNLNLLKVFCLCSELLSGCRKSTVLHQAKWYSWLITYLRLTAIVVWLARARIPLNARQSELFTEFQLSFKIKVLYFCNRFTFLIEDSKHSGPQEKAFRLQTAGHLACVKPCPWVRQAPHEIFVSNSRRFYSMPKQAKLGSCEATLVFLSA